MGVGCGCFLNTMLEKVLCWSDKERKDGEYLLMNVFVVLIDCSQRLRKVGRSCLELFRR